MRNSLVRNSFWLFLCICGAIIAGFGAFYLYLSPKLPAVDSLRHVKLQTPLRVMSADGKLIGEFGEKRRKPVAFDHIPEAYLQALLAAEDDQFYRHSGVSIKGLMRAASELASTGRIRSGGSTITMQVARNFFLTRQQTFARKLNEIFLALQIERELSKQEILELYVNVIFLGNRAYGISAAADVYYGKPLDELSLAQLAMIAGLPKAPSTFNPIANPERALIRRNWILGRMLSLGYIDQATYNSTIKEPVTASYHGISLDHHAPYVAEMARQKTVDIYGPQAYTDGLVVITTVNSELQATAQQAVIDGLLDYDARHGYRGPEQQWQPNFLDSSNNDPNELSNLDLSPWQSALKNIKTYAELKPAVVVQVLDKDAKALIADGQIIDIPWNNGIKSARKFRTENARGPSPKKAADVLAVGDVIRVKAKTISVAVKAGAEIQTDNQVEGEAKPEPLNTEITHWHLIQVPKAQAALVSLNPNNGAIQSLIGGFDFNQSHFNRATQAERQPGSNFKPFVYTAALENGFTPASIINDAPIVFEDDNLEQTWRPKNDGGKFYGPTRLRQALYRSRNLVSIRILRNIGIRKVINSMSRFGFDESKLPADLSLALGSHAATPLEIATAYAVFANGGYKVSPYIVESIQGVNGDKIYQAEPDTVCRECELAEYNLAATSGKASPEPRGQTEDHNSSQQQLAAELASELAALDEENQSIDAAINAELDTQGQDSDIEAVDIGKPKNLAKRVISPQVVYLIDSMLQDVITKGTGTKAKVLKRTDLAGKTGTTNGPKDLWFSGYNNNIVTTTWLGFDQNLLIGRNEYGGSGALPIWIDYMRTALKNSPRTSRTLPGGIVTVRIDPNTGERATINTKGAIYESFRTNFAPAAIPDSNLGIGNDNNDLPEEIF